MCSFVFKTNKRIHFFQPYSFYFTGDIKPKNINFFWKTLYLETLKTLSYFLFTNKLGWKWHTRNSSWKILCQKTWGQMLPLNLFQMPWIIFCELGLDIKFKPPSLCRSQKKDGLRVRVRWFSKTLQIFLGKTKSPWVTEIWRKTGK